MVERLKADVLNLPSLRSHMDELLTDLAEHRSNLQKQISALETQLGRAHQHTENLADALAQRPASPTLLGRLDKEEALQKRLEREIALKQTELTYWKNFEVHDEELAGIIEQMHANLESGNPAQARAAVSALIMRIDVNSGRPPTVCVQYTFPKLKSPDSTRNSRAVQGIDLMPPRGFEPLSPP